ncbi:hypothetical protein LTR78_010471 [Recurvomyces mirabilis]|uniref:Major facilitator superfamily (MFS) profile domain-containing protein n=1 Tax=Recurvomyces mirabilis TaxID=574656 RepID=A0AAE0WG75_9PEZI|nr:hypothetical protein LTR78_010471 [Recurvomyces mirabilis]KAK5150364.1 hypothetical protein LTS14_010203 [Recurvomyces mirabilis]
MAHQCQGLTSTNDILMIEKGCELPQIAIENNNKASDTILVTWNGEDDPSNPLNFSLYRKWTITVLISFGGLVCLMSSTMLAPALVDIAHDLDIPQASANMTLSIFVLAFAFGPMILAPMAEVFGRRNVWLASSLWYAAFKMLGGFSHNNGLLLASRLLAGLGSSVEFATSQPVLGDCWRADQRGQSFAIATFIPLLGPAIGPIVGGLITKSVGWRWIFWVLSIFDALLIIFAYFLFPETYGQVLLARKAAQLTQQTGNRHITEYTTHSQPLRLKLQNGFLRPGRLLLTQPVVQLVGLFMAFNYGTLFFVLSSYATLWTANYDESVATSGLHYTAFVVGYTLAAQGGARLTDRLWQHFKARSDGQITPEYRVPPMLPGTLLIPVGLLWYCWAAQVHAHWPIVDAGAAVFGCGIILSTQAMQQYIMESYKEYVASAAAASQFLRSIFGFCFPLFAPALYTRLGYGLGNTTIATVFMVLGIPAPFVLWFYGAQLRAKGRAVI